MLLAPLLLADVDMGADPPVDSGLRVAQRNGPGQERTVSPVLSEQRQLHLERRSGAERVRPGAAGVAQRGRGEQPLPVMAAAMADRHARVFVPLPVIQKILPLASAIQTSCGMLSASERNCSSLLRSAASARLRSVISSAATLTPTMVWSGPRSGCQ